jgi:hypothetical protein
MKALQYIKTSLVCVLLATLIALVSLVVWRVSGVDRKDLASAVHNFAEASANTSKATARVSTFVERVDIASKPVLDCVQIDPVTGKKKGNGACLPAQILATVGSVKAMAGAGAKAAPKVREAVERIGTAATASASNVQQLTVNLSDAGKKVGEQVAAIGGAATGLRADLAPTLAATQTLVENTDKRIGELTVPIQGTLVAVRSSAEGFQNFLPILQTNIVKFTDKAVATAGHIEKITKPHWYDKLVSWGTSGALIYFGAKK